MSSTDTDGRNRRALLTAYQMQVRLEQLERRFKMLAFAVSREIGEREEAAKVLTTRVEQMGRLFNQITVEDMGEMTAVPDQLTRTA